MTSNISKEIILISDVHNIKKSYFIDTTISVFNIINIFVEEFNIPNESFFLVSNGKILSGCNIIYPNNDKIIIELIPKLYGGFGFSDVTDAISDAVDGVKNWVINVIPEVIDKIFSPILSPLAILINFFKSIPNLFIFLAKTLLWLIEVIKWIFMDVLNLQLLFKDFTSGILTLVYTLCSSIISVFVIFFEKIMNGIGTIISGSIWGWDQSNLSKSDKQSNYFQNIKKCNTKKCYLSDNSKVPFSVLFGTILCPPLGVFMEYGITGWFNILICIALTLFFYVPGLIYALIIIYE